MILLANSLGFTTLAEGIETQENLNLLIELGCELGQGYYFDKPLVLNEFLERVEDNNKKTFSAMENSSKNIKKYLENFEKLPYGVAIAKNDLYSTIIQANAAFYNIIGYTNQSFLKKHENKLTHILVDNLYHMVKDNLSNNEFDFNFDIRIQTENENIIWVHDYVHYDPIQDVFYITIIDISNKMPYSDSTLSLEEYQIQKDISIYLINYTSAYLFVSDPKDHTLLYVNKNYMDLLGLTNNDQWRGKQLSELTHSSEMLINSEFYENTTEDKFNTREYYNDHLNLFLSVENKIITVMGKKMQLHIATDISDKKRIEKEISLQSSLQNCIEALYTSNDTTESFLAMLNYLKKYYNADRAYFFKLFDESVAAETVYEVLEDGIESGKEFYNAIPEEIKNSLIQMLSQEEMLYSKTQDIIETTKEDYLTSCYTKYNVHSFIYGAVKDTKNTVIGFIGIDNPSINTENTKLINLLSRFIFSFVKNTKTKRLLQEATKIEEISKLNVLEKCAKNLKSSESATNKITDILDLLRKHYGSNEAIILHFNKNEKTYDVVFESHDKETPSRLKTSRNRPIDLIQRWVEPFEKSHKYSVYSFDDLALTTQERENWLNYNISNTFIAPIFNSENVLTGILAVNNATIFNRSKALIHVVSKSISDYLEINEMKANHLTKVSMDLATGLLNKVSTEDKISSLLENEVEGVLFIIDIDYFKNLNDTLGHALGDQALIDLSNELKKTFRKNDILGRIGGDEFMVFSPNLKEKELIRKKAKSLCKKLNRKYKKDNVSTEISVSIGICFTNKYTSNFKQLYENADKALYDAKGNGKNTFSIFNNENNEELLDI